MVKILNNYLILGPIVFPIIVAIFMAYTNFKLEKIRNISVVSLVGCNFLIVLAACIYGTGRFDLFEYNQFIDVYFRIDKLSALFAVLSSFLWFFATIYSTKYMTHEGGEKKFYIFYILTLGVTMGIAFSGNLFTLYIFYELLTISTYPLVIHTGTVEAIESGKKYLIYSFLGATMVVIGMFFIYNYTANLDFTPFGVFGDAGGILDKKLLVVYVITFLGFGVKAALVPFHSWLPNAMVAPTPVSALLHAVAVVKSGIFALIRISYFIFTPLIIKQIGGHIFLITLIAITILMGSFLALHHDNIKKRLAYSTISQLGYILLGIALMNKESLTGGLLHLINHALIKIVLFFCAGAIYFNSGKKNISEIKGIGKQMPITMWCFTIASISLVGIPPTNGFVSKWYLALGGLNEGNLLFVTILLISAFFTASYLMPIVITAFFGKSETEEQKSQELEMNEIKEAPMAMLIPIVTLTVFIVLTGIFPNPLINYVESLVMEII